MAAGRETRVEHFDAAAAEAARWLVALGDAPRDAGLRERFEAWRAADPVNDAAWAETSRVYAAIGELARTRRARPVPRRAALAGAVALAATLAAFALPGAWLRLQADFVTATAELRTAELADGSTLRLGPDSAVAVELGPGERRVRSLRGVAFFEVAPDAARPFRVEAGEVIAAALGTRFEVRRRGEAVEVAVREGRVRVDHGQGGELTRGQRLRVTATGEVARSSVPPERIAAWLDGRLIARDRPLAEVVDELRPYFRGVILLTDRTLAARTLTGVYDLADPAAALRAIATAHGAVVRRISPWLLWMSSS